MSQAISGQRLVASVGRDERDRPFILDSDLADREWAQNTNLSEAPTSVIERSARAATAPAPRLAPIGNAGVDPDSVVNLNELPAYLADPLLGAGSEAELSADLLARRNRLAQLPGLGAQDLEDIREVYALALATWCPSVPALWRMDDPFPVIARG